MDERPDDRFHQVGTEAFLHFAEGQEGRIVNVRDVPNGKRCGCVCPECRGPLVANQGRKRAWHFSHYVRGACNPKRALETSLHRFAKQIIQERAEIRLPPVVALVGGVREEIHGGGVFRPTDVAQEVAMPSMRPDIVARRGDRTLFVEVAVWHKVGRAKQILIEERRQTTIEIDLNGCRHETDASVLERLILHDAPREWLFNSAKYELEEPARKLEKALAAAQVAREETVAQHVLADLDKAPSAEAPTGSDLAQHIQAIESAGFRDAIGLPIQGDGAFLVGPRTWQALVLEKLLWAGESPISVHDYGLARSLSTVVRRVLVGLPGERNARWDLIEQRTAGRVRPPQVVLQAYLELMVERGFLAWQESGLIGCSKETAARVRSMVQHAEAVVQSVGTTNALPQPSFRGLGRRRWRL